MRSDPKPGAKKKLTPEQVEKIRRLLSNPDSPMSRTQVARRFGIGVGTMAAYLKGDRK